MEISPQMQEKINQFSLVKLLPEKNSKLLIQNGKLIVLRPGQLLFEEGSRQSSMYLILSGELKIFIDDATLALRGAGEYIGEMSMIDPKVRSASARSTCETELFELDKSLFDSIFANEPKILMEILKIITTRARDDLEILKVKKIELQEFAQFASHDLQEPLRKVINFGKLLKDHAGELDEKSLDYIQRMQKAALRMQRFIDDLLNFSMIGIRQLDFKKVKLKDLMHTICDDLNHLIFNTKAVVNVSELPELRGVETRLYQLFLNLIRNSIKFRKEDQPLVVNIFSRKNDNGDWVICVEDNGIGFDEEYADRIFLPFQQLHGKSEYEGSGLGLSISKKIVQQHNGELTVKSQPGKGSMFTITFPDY